MSIYEIKDTGIKSDTEVTSAVATISYEVENALYNSLKNGDIRKQITTLQDADKFPSNLEFIDCFYDSKTSLSGVAFADKTTGKVTVGFAGTNLDNGLGETVKDVSQWGAIAFNGNGSDSTYFNEGHKFIQKLQLDYSVDTITGHSLGARNGAIIGMSNQIPNIILYNAAPLQNSMGQGLASVVQPFGGLSRMMNDVDLMKIIKSYEGRLVYFISEDDPLNKYAGLFGSLYPGTKLKIYNEKGHDISGFLTKEEQVFIEQNLLMIDESGKSLLGLEAAKNTTSMKLKELSSLRKQLLASGGGLSSSEEIFLDATEALVMTEGMKQAIQAELTELQSMYKKGIENAEELWRETRSDASIIGATLTSDEELEALESGGATEAKILTKPVAKYESTLSKVNEIEQEYNQLIDKIKAAINSQLTADQSLARQIGGV